MRTLMFILVVTMLLGSNYAWSEKPLRGEMPLDDLQIGEPQVEVNLSGSLFKFVAAAVGKDDRHLAEFLLGLKSLKVRVYGGETDAEGHPRPVTDILSRYKARLTDEGWEVLARIRQEDSNVGVYVLSDGDQIDGLFVVVSESTQLVLVNLVGNIDLAQVSKIGKVAGVDLELPDLDPTRKRPTEEQREQMRRHREGALESLMQGQVENAIAEMKQVPMLHGNLPQDDAFLALLHQMLGEQDAAYYYLGRAYEAQQDRDFARELYRQAKRINPDNPLLEAF